MENDTLEAVKVSVTDDNLKLKILTQPYENPYWYDIDKLTKVHDVEFDITGLKKGRYNLNLQINNTFTHRGDFSIN